MKSAARLVLSTGLFIVLWVLPASSIGVLALGTSFAHALPLADSEVHVDAKGIDPSAYDITACSGCGCDGSCGGPVPHPQTVTAFYYNTWNDPSYGSGYSVARIDVVADFAHPLSSNPAGSYSFGYVGAHAIAEAGGPYGSATAEGYAQLRFWVTSSQNITPPWLPTVIPIDIVASGNGEATGDYGFAQGSVYVAGLSPQPTFQAVSASAPVNLPNYPSSSSFNEVVPLYVPPGSPFIVYVGGGAMAWAQESGSQFAQADVSIDPSIMFDQAAFDTMYPGNAFQLSDYYALDISPNVPISTSVPEPTTMLLLGLGLIGLAEIRRKLKM